MRAFLTPRWAPLTAVVATVAYAVTVIGFGLNYRPLHNDEGVTLSVASRPSARDVLDVAIDDRHGPPLHYRAVHASLVLRDDMLGLRLPSALFGILAIALAYGFGRELLGRSGGAVLAVLVATIPEVVHLAQFARGYTAMLAASFGSMWLLLLLVRTRRARYAAPYAVSALLLVAAHPFGLFALASEMLLLVVLGLAPLRHGWRSQRRNVIVLSLALGTGVLAMLLLWRVYSQFQPKYGVGQGGAVVYLGLVGVLAPHRKRLDRLLVRHRVVGTGRCGAGRAGDADHARPPRGADPAVRQRRRVALDRRRARAGRLCPALWSLRGPGRVRQRLAVAVARRRPGYRVRPGRAPRRSRGGVRPIR